MRREALVYKSIPVSLIPILTVYKSLYLKSYAESLFLIPTSR